MSNPLINKAEAEKLAMSLHLLSIGLSLVEMYGNEVRHELKAGKPKVSGLVFQATTNCGQTLERIMKDARMDTERAYTVTEDVIELIKVFSTKHPEKRAEILRELKK